LLVDGGSTDKTREIITEFTEKYPFIKMLENPKRITPSGLNIGITNSKHTIIFRIDAHTIYPSNYFTLLSEYLINLQADNVGGVCRTLPESMGLIPSIIAKAMNSLFGMGNSYFRIGTPKIREVDTVPFGCYRREIFDQIGLFDEELIRNQDDEFNGRLIKNGGHIYLIPEIVIDYYARGKIGKLSQMFYQYGLFKPLVKKKLKRPATIRQFFPFLFASWIILGGIFCVINESFIFLYLGVIALYFMLALIFAAKDSQTVLQFLLLPFIFFIIHMSYGWGYIKGIFQFILFRLTPGKVEISR
jgi:GT2 family glycosyltransferase